MIIGKMIVDRIGDEIPEDKRAEVTKQIDEAIQNKTFHIIEKNGKEIGFFTYVEKDDKILVNNCYIFKWYRDTNNLLGSRHFLKEKHRSLYWLNGKRKRRVEYAPS